MEKAVGPQVLVDLGKMQFVAGLAAGSGNAGFRIGNNPRGHIHPARFEQRSERQDHGGRIAAGI